MLLEIMWKGESTRVDLADGTVKVGGSTRDDICITGLPPGLIALTIDGANVVVTSNRSVRIGAALFPARVPRLLVDGEDLQLPNEVVVRRVANLEQRRESRKLVGTAFVAKELLGAKDVDPQNTRAATLTCVTGFDQGVTFAIAFERMVLGRADDADVRIRDRAVSRRHAQLTHAGKLYLLKALSTTNGVFVNGLRVKDERVLATGDVIELGQTMLRFDGPERAPEEATNVTPTDPQLPPARPPPPPADALEPPAPRPAPPVQAVATQPAVTPAHTSGFSFELIAIGVGTLLALVGAAATMMALHQ